MKTSLSNYKVEASFTVYVNLRKCYPVQCRMQVIAAKTQNLKKYGKGLSDPDGQIKSYHGYEYSNAKASG